MANELITSRLLNKATPATQAGNAAPAAPRIDLPAGPAPAAAPQRSNADWTQLATWGGLALLGLAVLIAAPMLFLGRAGGSNVRTMSLAPGAACETRVEFKKGVRVRITVTSVEDSDVDLFVHDRNNVLVVKDEYDSKNCMVEFTPAETQTFKIVVANRLRLEHYFNHRNRHNNCTLTYEQK